eukprot:9494853-Pyramimonas_sp.AAC.3
MKQWLLKSIHVLFDVDAYDTRATNKPARIEMSLVRMMSELRVFYDDPKHKDLTQALVFVCGLCVREREREHKTTHREFGSNVGKWEPELRAHKQSGHPDSNPHEQDDRGLGLHDAEDQGGGDGWLVQ